MTSLPPASREEIAALLGEVDTSYVDRVLDTGASVDEIAEAIGDLEVRSYAARREPSSARVIAVRTILEELVEGAAVPRVLPVRGTPIGQPT